jgi:hypothetical protein
MPGYVLASVTRGKREDVKTQCLEEEAHKWYSITSASFYWLKEVTWSSPKLEWGKFTI